MKVTVAEALAILRAMWRNEASLHRQAVEVLTAELARLTEAEKNLTSQLAEADKELERLDKIVSR